MENIIYFLVLFMFSVKMNCLEGSALNLSLFEKKTDNKEQRCVQREMVYSYWQNKQETVTENHLKNSRLLRVDCLDHLKCVKEIQKCK